MSESLPQPGAGIIDELNARGLIQDHTDMKALRERLDRAPIAIYCGFDPTADSLHIGHLVPLLVLRRFQDFGHRAIALAGGATGMVGDPSGRSDERNLLDEKTLRTNVEAVRGQLTRILTDTGDAGFELVNNYDWTAGIGVLDFLRDVGKHVTINVMLGKESIRSRLDGESGLSFTEFSYMLLQANDFYELNQRLECELQVGGSDQWGNITAGIDMIRRRTGQSAYGLTVPLVTRSDGQKFGKSVAGAVFLSPTRTLPYEFHQYFVRTDDRDVERFLLQLTLLPVDEVAEIMARHDPAPEHRIAQIALADAITQMVHGADELERVKGAANVLFTGDGALSLEALEAIRGTVPESEAATSILAGTEPVVDLLVLSGLAKSKGDARRTIQQGGVSVNGHKVTAPDDEISTLADKYVLLQKGKKQRHIVVLAD